MVCLCLTATEALQYCILERLRQAAYGHHILHFAKTFRRLLDHRLDRISLSTFRRIHRSIKVQPLQLEIRTGGFHISKPQQDHLLP